MVKFDHIDKPYGQEAQSSCKIFDPITGPTISVVIPAFNCERFIGQTLDSIYAQTRRPDQVVVLDDGSTDGTADVVEGYCFTEDRFQSYLSFVGKVFPEVVLNGYCPDTRSVELILLRQKNHGPSATRNLGIQHSKGDWIAFLDADDLWTPMAIESLLGMTCDYPQSSFVFGDGLNFSESGETLEKVSSHFDDFPNGQIDGAFEYFAKGNPILNGAVLVLKDTILKAGGFREDVSHGEDYDLWLKLALFTQVACTDSLVMLRRRRSGALSENQEAFYKAGPSIFTDIKKEHGDLLISQEIYIGKHISTARYKLAYFYYVNGMYLKATLATVRWAWGRFTSLLEGGRTSGLQKGK